jgi:zinc finger MYND domain-containing protein 10
MYHEATVTNILELFLYHRTAAECCEETLVELIDYCYRKFTALNIKWENMPDSQRNKAPLTTYSKEDLEGLNPEKDIDRQYAEIEFTCAMTCLSLIRFITDHMEGLPASIIHQLMENCDIPLSIVPILEYRPWFREDEKGNQEKFEDNKWTLMKQQDQGRISKQEGQIWLTIYNLFMTQASNQKYELTTFRKANLLRLKKFMNEVLLDQLPLLAPMLRGFEEMSLMPDNNIKSTSSFIVEVLPELRAKIYNNRNWKTIAMQQMSTYFRPDTKQAKEDLDRMMKLYSSDVFEDFMDDPICAICGAAATQRCSKCKQKWYCSRDCQLRDWKKHKPICALF